MQELSLKSVEILMGAEQWFYSDVLEGESTIEISGKTAQIKGGWMAKDGMQSYPLTIRSIDYLSGTVICFNPEAPPWYSINLKFREV